jgi:hypothetical protein
MPDRPSSPLPKVTLEDLLRLKRAERPPPAFWTEFERDLRQKQLAALVERRSWWHGFAAVYGRFGRLGIPLGATAIFAVTFLSIVRYSQSEGESRLVSGTNFPTRVAVAQAQRMVSAQPIAVTDPTSIRRLDQLAVTDVASAPSAAVDAPRETAKEGTGAISWLDHLPEGRERSAELTVADSMAVNLVPATLEPALVAPSLGFEDRAMPAMRVRHSAELLPTAAAATESRRARLLAALGSAVTNQQPEPAAPEHARRSVIRHMDEDGLDHLNIRPESEGALLSIRF